jgi:hypothetical protein
MASRERVIENFVARYGAERLAWLLDAFARGESGQVIADALGVSRERVRTWRDAFGTAITVYQVHPEVEAALARLRGD